MKLILFILLLKNLLFATTVTQSQQNSILMEAALFVGVFGVMGIISYIYSSRHAKAYKSKKVSVEEEGEKEIINPDRISELSAMLENKILTQEEFELLNNYYLKTKAIQA